MELRLFSMNIYKNTNCGINLRSLEISRDSTPVKISSPNSVTDNGV